jgi:hypothetical protein
VRLLSAQCRPVPPSLSGQRRTPQPPSRCPLRSLRTRRRLLPCHRRRLRSLFLRRFDHHDWRPVPLPMRLKPERHPSRFRLRLAGMDAGWPCCLRSLRCSSWPPRSAGTARTACGRHARAESRPRLFRLMRSRHPDPQSRPTPLRRRRHHRPHRPRPKDPVPEVPEHPQHSPRQLGIWEDHRLRTPPRGGLHGQRRAAAPPPRRVVSQQHRTPRGERLVRVPLQRRSRERPHRLHYRSSPRSISSAPVLQTCVVR